MHDVATPPAEPNMPPTTTSPPASTDSAFTRWNDGPATPAPSGLQTLPFQLAIELALTPPAVVKSPPAITSPLGRTATAFTVTGMPLPRADQVLPFQPATWVGGT